MWNAYTSHPDSVAIVTSAKALYKFVPARILKSLVKYHADNFPRTEFNHTALFFYKPKCYRFEQEFRMLLAPEENGSIGLDEVGWCVPVNLKKLVHRVITHPRASADCKMKVDLLMKRYLPNLRRGDSILSP